MSFSLSRDRIAEIVGGQVQPDSAAGRLACRGLEYDSREVRGGELFVALAGANTHGERYLPQAWERGAALALVESPELLCGRNSERVIVTKDALAAFSKLAAFWRDELALPLVGVTGSVGKTTIKEMTASLLLRRSPGMYSRKSHNNHVGVPYTICCANRNHSWAVVEMGMNHAGEIRKLTRLARPDVAVISKIAPAHIEFFGSLEAIAAAKLEIVEGLKPGGTLVYNNDDAVLRGVLDREPVVKSVRLRRFGLTAECDSRVTWVKSFGLDGIEFGLQLGQSERAVRLSLPGRQSALNAACAALIVVTLFPDYPLDEIVAGLGAFRAPLMRLQLCELGDGRRVLDDSYNANPASMQALLELAQDIQSAGLRVGLVLGDMCELGALSEKYHHEIGELAARVSPQFVVAVGHFAELMVAAARKAGIEAWVAPSPEDAGREAFSKKSDVIIVKASRAIGLDRAVRTMQDRAKRGSEA